jgi:uridine phosphorylase
VLKDLTRDEWLGFLDLDAEQIPTVLVLRGTRNLRRHYDIYRSHFSDVQEIGSPNALFEDVFIGRRAGINVGYASVYGPAMASEVTHLFAVLGTELVIQTGVCGALGDGIAAGDLVVATHARCAEGAADCYLPGIVTVDASAELVAAVMADTRVETPRYAGPVWTTAALLAEGKAEIDQWYGEGYIAADMETATTFAVAAYFGMRRLSVLSVFDNPREGAHLGLTESAKDALAPPASRPCSRCSLP